MFYSSEKNLVFIIRYAPLLLIISLSIIITYFVELSNNVHFDEEKDRITKYYTEVNKEELQEEIYRAYNNIVREEKNSKDNLKKYLKQRVYEAHSIASIIYEKNKKTKSKKEILELIKSALGSIIYNKGRGYYFINNIDGTNILQPLNKKIENTNILNIEDVNGYKFIKSMVQSIKDKSERFDSYYWYKNDKDKIAYEKISFYKYFEPYDLTIGTGEYLVDFENEIKNKLINNIQNLELKDDGYIFLIDFDGNMLVHKNIENVGKNFINIQDPNGKKIIQEFIKIAKEGEGFISYFNTTLNKEPYKKTSFIKGYEKWNWVLGIGYSDEELLNMIKNAKNKLYLKNQKNYEQILIVSALITIVFLLVSIFISRYLENIFKKYKLKIQKEEKSFRNLFEYSNIGLAICNDKGKFIEVNNKFIEILGYELKEIEGKYLNEITEENLKNDDIVRLNELINGKRSSYTLEKVFIRSNKEKIDVLLTANIFKIEDKVENILFSIIDISEIKKKDNILSQQSKMASMGEMIANIAHQWRQPLSLISTLSSGMKIEKEFGTLNDKKFDINMDLITESTQYLSETIDDFKNFFKPNENASKFEIETVINKSIRLMQTKSKDINFVNKIENIEIETFENDLIQILINLIKNAIDALDNVDYKKYIFIETSMSSDENKIFISVKDNAGGIKEDILDKIFEPYFTTKHKSNGTGIGLYMVNQIIQKHSNGNISVENVEFDYEGEKYKGSYFKIELPIKI